MSQKKERNTRSQVINFCFTLNNPTMEEELDLLCTDLPVTYIMWGEEVGEKETPHLQGYCELNHRMRWNTIKNLGIGFERMHIEGRRGSQKEAINYCKKDGKWIEYGTKKTLRPGQRRDLDEIRTAAQEQGMAEVSKWASYQEIKVAEKYLQYNEEKREWKPNVIWLWGKTGTGKSRLAHKMYPDAYVKGEPSKWFDGYDRHPDVILDDFRGNWMTFAELLTLLDRYPRRVEFKGGSRQFVARNIVITSCETPQAMYKVGDERIDQLLRRIDIIKEMNPQEDTNNIKIEPKEEIDQLIKERTEAYVKMLCETYKPIEKNNNVGSQVGSGISVARCNTTTSCGAHPIKTDPLCDK